MWWMNLANPVALWWIFLVVASLVNIIAWSWTRFYFSKNHSFKTFRFNKLLPENLIWFSGIYVFGCAYRSIFTKADVQKICLYDTWFSSVFLGRSVATIAELAFVIQWAIVIRFLGKHTKDDFIKTISYLIVPLIFIAECFSWYAVITTHYLGNTIEESLWTLTYLLIMIALVKLWPKFKGAFQYALGISIFCNFTYILFMIFVDVHMYFTRWQTDIISNKKLFGFIDGIVALNTQWIVTHDINQWRTEIPWMSLYFSLAVLVSIGICYIPLTSTGLKKHLKA
jgi:hypothetical protein